MRCYCEHGHLLNRAPHWVKYGRTKCGRCHANVKIRPLTRSEEADFALKVGAKNNCLGVSILRRSRKLTGCSDD